MKENEEDINSSQKVKVWMYKLKEVLEDENTTLLSDKDLFYLVNSLLPRIQNISMSYYEFLKSPNQKNSRSISSLQYLTDEEKEDFLNTLNVGRVMQKMNLTKKAFDDDKKNAYPYLWALERKNTHLQLKQNLSIGNGNITLQIEGADATILDMVDVMEVDYEEQKTPLITKKENDDGISETK